MFSRFLLVLLLLPSIISGLKAEKSHDFSEDEIRERMSRMPLLYDAKYDKIVKSYLQTYFVRSRPKAKRIIGHSSLYFPIFEKYIHEKQLPKDLRILPIVESALNPNAVSRSRAVGLWQFMSPTAKEYGLSINTFVDERMDPHKSTQAALTYLEKLYKKYKNWPLALAAYNAGPGTVNKAIKRAKSKNFWKVKKYLPRETQNYIPAFTAAAYLLKYYKYHGISPEMPDLELQITEFIKVYNNLTFNQIKDITGVEKNTIKVLNPSYKAEVIPANPNGNYLILPSKAAHMLSAFLKGLKNLEKTPKANFIHTNYTVQEGDQLYKIAKAFGCKPYHILLWNSLQSEVVLPGQTLKVFTHKPSDKKLASERRAPIKVPQNIQPLKLKPIDRTLNIKNSKYLNNKEHISRTGECLLDICKKYNLTLADLYRFNPDLKSNPILYRGRIIKMPPIIIGS